MLNLIFLLAANLTPTTANEFLQPQLAASQNLVAVAFGSPDKIYVSSSRDRGVHFGEPHLVAAVPGLNLHNHRGPRVAITPGAIVISAINGADLLTWRSTDSGETWRAGGTVNDFPKAAREGLHAMAAGADGTLFAAWLDLRGTGTRLYGAASQDNGVTWSKNVRIYESPDGTICQCCHPTVAFAPDGSIEIMYRNALNGSRDMYLATSHDGGKTFSSPEKLGGGTWKLNACPMDGGGLAFSPEGKLISAWRRGNDVYLAPEGGAETAVHEGKNPAIAANAEGVFVAWTSPEGVFARVPGKPEPVMLDKSGAFVQLVAIPHGGVLAAWERKGTLQFHTLPVTGPLLIVLTFGAIALLLVLILVARLHAFFALLLTSMALGLACGLPPAALMKSIQAGTGDALGFIAIVLGLGAMIGAFLEHSGGGRVLADYLIKVFGKENAAWAVLVASFLVGLPIFFEVGFIILVPLVWNLAKESKRSLLFFGMAMAAPLTITHSLVPPHPAPAAAAQLLGASLGSAILYGALLSIPLSLFGGIFYGKFIANRIYVPVPEIANKLEANATGNPPSVGLVFFLLVLPVILILAATVAGPQNAPLIFLGNPFAALAVTALLCMYFFGVRRGLNRDEMAKLAMNSFIPAGSLLLIMGGGGAFKQVIVDTGVGAYAGKLLVASHISPLLVAFLIALAMRAAQGSATVAIITAAGIIAPLMKAFTGVRPEMIYLAVCCGGSGISHVNDAGFWLVNQYFGMTVPQTLKSWTTMKVLTCILGFLILLLVQAFL